MLVIDAISTGAGAGTITVLGAEELHGSAGSCPSSHSAGLDTAVALGRALDRLPDALVIAGIEPADLDHGDTLSDPVGSCLRAFGRSHRGGGAGGMCLSDLGRVVHHDRRSSMATVEIDGREVEVSTIALGLDPPALASGDWLIIHTGLAIEQISDDEARAIRRARDDQPAPVTAARTEDHP